MKIQMMFNKNDEDDVGNKFSAIYVKFENGATKKYFPDEYPKVVGLYNGAEFWADEGSKIKQLPIEYIQPYAALCDDKMMVWLGWPPNLSDTKQKPDTIINYNSILNWKHFDFTDMKNHDQV